MIKEAQKRLKILEKQQQQQLQSVVQNDLFANVDQPEPETQEQIIEIEKVIEIIKPSPVLDTLANIDLDDLTPRQALEQLYALKAALKS